MADEFMNVVVRGGEFGMIGRGHCVRAEGKGQRAKGTSRLKSKRERKRC
jgi:hypothetical protein